MPGTGPTAGWRSPDDLTGSWSTASAADRGAAGTRRRGNAGMGYDTYSLGSSGGLGGMGQTVSGGQYQDGGDRRLENSSVNYGGFAGIQNWLQNAPPGQQAQRAAYLSAQGMMPSYNGVPLSTALG